MLTFCGLTWWKKPEYPDEITDLGRATTTLPHADAGKQTRASGGLPLRYPDRKRHFSHRMTKWHVRPAKTQISLGIRPVWSESSLSAWRNLGSLATHWAYGGSDQTGWVPRLIGVFAGRTGHWAYRSCCFCHAVAYLVIILTSDCTNYCQTLLRQDDCQTLPDNCQTLLRQGDCPIIAKPCWGKMIVISDITI